MPAKRADHARAAADQLRACKTAEALQKTRGGSAGAEGAALAQDRVGELHARLVRLGAALLTATPCSERASQNGQAVVGAYLSVVLLHAVAGA